MRAVNKIRSRPNLICSVVPLVATLSLIAACSGANPIQLPAQLSAKNNGVLDTVLDTKSNDPNQRGGEPNSASELQQSPAMAERVELIGDTLLALQSLAEVDVENISASDLEDATTQTECQFAALNKNSGAIMSDSRFSQDGSLFRFSPNKSNLSLASCRCLVEKHSSELGLALQPVSGL